MRWGHIAVLAAGMALCGAAVAAVDRADKPAGEFATKRGDVKNMWFKATAGGKPVGHWHLRVTRTQLQVVLQESYTLRHRGAVCRVEAEIVYTASERPQPVRAKASTFIGDTKLMDGKLEFLTKIGADGTKRKLARMTATGYASKRGEKYDPPKRLAREIPCPDGWLMFTSALIGLVPEMKPEGDAIDKVVIVEFPDDIDFPELVHMKEGGKLQWKKAADEKTTEIRLTLQPRPDMKPHDHSRVTVDDKGKVTAGVMGKMTLTPARRKRPRSPSPLKRRSGPIRHAPGAWTSAADAWPTNEQTGGSAGGLTGWSPRRHP